MSVDQIAEIAKSQRTPGHAAKLRAAFMDLAAPDLVREAAVQLREAQNEWQEFYHTIPTTMVMHETERRAAHVLERGAYDRRLEPVEPGVPAAISAGTMPAGTDRLALAQWIVSPQNPLPARVAVNHQWQHFFGSGLVETSEDFGTQGSPPSHPELLDWLACELLEHGWDLKQIHRLIVTSAVYRQSSRVAPELLHLDPENRLLARGPRLRLSAEMIRDQALAVSGLLEERSGGPSYFPYQPEGLWAEIASTTNYRRSDPPELYRRSLYSYWKRTVSNPAMSAFDAPTREACVVRRSRTNTPLQALTLLNETTFVEAARKLAERVLRESGENTDKRLVHAFRLVTARRPNERELSVLRAALERHHARFSADAELAEQLLSTGDSPVDRSVDTAELAAYSALAGVLLNLDEVITRE